MKEKNHRLLFQIVFIRGYKYLFFIFFLIAAIACDTENKNIDEGNCAKVVSDSVFACILSIKNYDRGSIYGKYSNVYTIAFKNLRTDSIGLFDCGEQSLSIISSKAQENVIDSVFLPPFPFVLAPLETDTIKIHFSTDSTKKMLDWKSTRLHYKRDKSKCKIRAKHPPNYYVEELDIRCWCQNQTN